MKKVISVYVGAATLSVCFSVGVSFAIDHETCNPTRQTSIPQGIFSVNYRDSVLFAKEREGRAFAEGDIYMGEMQDLIFDKEGKAAPRNPLVKDFRWVGGIVPYEIEANFPNAARITRAIAHWTQRTGGVIQFIPRDPKVHKDYLVFTRDLEFNGGWSSVGRQGGKQYLGLGDPAGAPTVIHELGHALGLWHEQSRKDRDQFVRVLWCNIQEQYRYNFLVKADSILMGVYDYNSIMHYSKWAFSANGLPSLATKTWHPVPWFNRISTSPKDVQAITCLYSQLNCPK